MRYKEYKNVDIPWLDEIPSHWEINKGKHVFEISTGKLDANQGELGGKYPFFTCSQKPRRINEYAFDCEALLVSGNGNVGQTQYYNGKFNAYQRVYVLNNIKRVETSFLKWYISNVLPVYLQNRYVGSVINFIVVGDLRSFPVLIPPREEQEQIARFLDRKINEIGRLIFIREKQIKNLEKTRRILIIDTMLNNDYKSVMLSRCVSENKRKNTNSNQNLLSLSYGKIIRKDINSTFGLLPEKFDKYQLVDKGNIILRLTDLQNDHKSLRVGLVKEKGIITSAYIGLICNDMVIPEYLYYYLNAMDLRKDFYSMGAGVRQNLNYNELKKINIKLPDKDTQKYIIDYLNENEIRIKKIIKSKEKQINNLQLLKKSLISDVVTGKIDVRKISIPEYEK